MGDIRIRSWHGQKADSEVVEGASESQLRDAIDALDNKVTTEVTVDQADGSYLSIGGGAGRYHVSYGNSEDEYFTLQDESRSGGEEKLVTGGQLGVFDAASVVGKSLAVRAAATFLESGRLDDSLTWKES
ncbi:Imm1 family immunity protein [Kibdelosporangium aridum]|uniref:Immunity protein Imm1 n=1 Tax=Kibdelosporangium aridum TaxID=2030 RepID=A0A1Y5Y4N3_KIBAR|nr:Imm1 family immunity protein [Kibdelosporangium aridum]SMD23859.1 Immunity protein Imm1 [Kibdelosporangium aridum]